MLGWYYFTKIMSRSTSGLTDDRWLICIRECEQDDFTNLIITHVLFQLIINGIRIIISGEELFGSQVCPCLFFIR